MKINPKAISIGAVFFLILFLLIRFISSYRFPFFELVEFIGDFFAIFLAGAITAYFARCHEILNGAVCGFIGSILVGLAQYVWELLGLPGDAVGFIGSLFMAVLCSPIVIFISGFGAACMQNFKSKVQPVNTADRLRSG